MVAFETPDVIAARRFVTAGALAQGRADLRGYPFRHLSVVAPDGGRGLTPLMLAVEHLTGFGWELVNVARISDIEMVAVLRRTIMNPNS